jgi:hypothetical protein
MTMTPQEIVRTRFPQAHARYQEAVYESGQRALIQPEQWVVQASSDLGAAALGRGASEEAAWLAAAERVQNRSRKSVVSFKEWLAQEAERERRADQRQELIEDWTDAVAALFAQMVQWMAEDDPERMLRIETGKITKDEEGLGAYEVALMRVSLGVRSVDLIPVGRNVVGGIGRRGDLGFRSEGRVDMTNGVEKYMLYRAVTPQGKEWMIVEDEQYRVIPLTREAFEAALQDLLS